MLFSIFCSPSSMCYDIPHFDYDIRVTNSSNQPTQSCCCLNGRKLRIGHFVFQSGKQLLGYLGFRATYEKPQLMDSLLANGRE